MNHRHRMEICLAGGSLDRSPVALWRHFPVDDQSPDGLARATTQFQRLYEFDLVKVTPASSFCLKDWGVQDEWRGAVEGTRDYTNRVITHPEDWLGLPLLDPRTGHLAAQLECLRLLVAELGPDTPILQTIFNPLSQAKNLAGQENLLVHLRQDPDALIAGLKTITESTVAFVEAAIEVGIDGVFFAVQHATYRQLSESEYHQFGREFDLPILEASGEMWLNMLHLHGERIMFDLFLDYPVQVVNWHDRETEPGLKEALQRFQGVVCGGLQRWDTMLLGTPAQVTEQARDALQVTGGQRFILGTGCVTPTTVPHGNILAARESVELGS